MAEGLILKRSVSEKSNTSLQATGGTITEVVQKGVIYRVHTFTSTGTFEVVNISASEIPEVEFVIVAGGGGGGVAQANNDCGGGGGGAGGYISSVEGEQSGGGCSAIEKLPVSLQSYNVIVGSGGSGALSVNTSGSKGEDSYILVGPELVNNGTFDTDTSGWNILDEGSDTQTVSNGQIIINRGPTGGNFVTQQIVDVTPNQTYIVSLDIISYSESWSLEIAEQPGNNDLLDIRGQTELGRQRFKVTPTVDQISITLGAGNSANTEVVMDNVSCMPATYLSVGGGGGSSRDATSGNGGSAGGGSCTGLSGSSVECQGFSTSTTGGTPSGATYGGGGSAGPGNEGPTGRGGSGGDGVMSYIDGTPTHRAAGGGGGRGGNAGGGPGGLGGGGNGGNAQAEDGSSAQPNTGSGGGGAGGYADSNSDGGNGADGVVIIRYRIGDVV